MSIQIRYNSFRDSIIESNWQNKINHAIAEIKKSPTGQVLISELEKESRRFQINSKCRLALRSTYPKITSFERDIIRVIIPTNKYDTEVWTFGKNCIYKSNEKIPVAYMKICQNIDVSIPDIVEVKEDFKSSDNSKKKNGKLSKQPFFIILAHELIHVLRHIKGYHHKSYEEEATIHGVEGLTLYLNSFKITENQIRQELGLNYRVNHEANLIN